MNLPLSLGDNLVLRRAETEEDIERIIALDNLVIQEGEPGVDVSVWVRLMTRGDHPTTTRRDFYLVEDTRKDLFVSSLCLIPQTWTYDGIPFGAGRPEIVMTLPEYRRRGLVRRQFEALHDDCAARGLLVQGIAGIPFYYRLFDYEYALSLHAGCDLYFDAIPERKADGAEPYPFRLADEADLPQLMALAGAYGSDKLVTCVRDETIWRHVLNEPAHADSTRYYMLTDGEGGPVVGYFGMLDELWFGRPALREFALVERVPYAAVVPSLLRALRQLCAARWPEIREIQIELGDDHPAYPMLATLGARQRAFPYAWYIRVPDVAGFIRHVAPALEARLAASAMAGYSGELKLHFYQKPGVRIRFESGCLAQVEATDPTDQEAQAAFPPLVFLKMLFGYRTYDELKHVFPDVSALPDARFLLDALFPRRPSWVVPVH
ncbi:MAG: hypothetical protein Kow00120_22170 [Anaerolineae bacterium]